MKQEKVNPKRKYGASLPSLNACASVRPQLAAKTQPPVIVVIPQPVGCR